MKAIPILKVSSFELSDQFYTKLGFTRMFVYRPDPSLDDPAYAGYEMDDAILHISSHSGDSNFGTAVFFQCDGVERLYKRIESDLADSITLVPTEQTWGNREMYLQDPDGNSLRFCETIAKADS